MGCFWEQASAIIIIRALFCRYMGCVVLRLGSLHPFLEGFREELVEYGGLLRVTDTVVGKG